MTLNITNLDDDKLAWIWAYRTQLMLLDGFDARGVDCAKNDKWDVNTWKQFLHTYGLRRGIHGSLPSKFDEIGKSLIAIFRTSLSQFNKTQELLKIWESGICIVAEHFDNIQSGKKPRLLSMTSKFLWFYQPNEMTMFDDYAVKALKKINRIKKPITTKDFLLQFDELYKQNHFHIMEAAQYSDRAYPYPKRVLDKWLWLKGSGKEKEKLDCFRWSLEQAPIK